MKIGIIGGSGLENPNLLKDYQELNIQTPFGEPSSLLITGKIQGVETVIISRHGRKHEITPTFVNNRANIYALKEQSCEYIIATTAVGSLKEEIKRGDFVIPDQLIDFTKNRISTFYENFASGPVHTPMADPFSELLREKLAKSCEQLKFRYNNFGTIVTIEGPRFSTRAESKMFRLLGGDVINMSTAPEAILAKEAGLQYATIAMSTDYDCWKKDENPVTWDIISQIMKNNSEKVQQVLIRTLENF